VKAVVEFCWERFTAAFIFLCEWVSDSFRVISRKRSFCVCASKTLSKIQEEW